MLIIVFAAELHYDFREIMPSIFESLKDKKESVRHSAYDVLSRLAEHSAYIYHSLIKLL